MASDDKKQSGERPTGSRPNQKPQDKESRKQGDGEEASAGDAPIDPADAEFIESSK